MRDDDKAYREWIRRHPSCISGRFSEWKNGSGRCVAAHVRRAVSSGTGYKPEFSCVPLTDEEHQLQHQHGEEYFYSMEWWDAQVLKYLSLWRKRFKD